MDAFDYSALDASGIKRSGTLMAGSAREARDLLRARALTPLDLNQSRKKGAKTGVVAGSKNFGSGKIKHTELTRATRQLAILIDAATPIEDALRVTALQFEKSPMKGVLLSIRSQVVEGATLSQALRSQPQAFSELYTAMVSSGETSGKLPEVLLRLADDLEAAQAIRRKIAGATAYPLVLTVVALVVIVVLMIFVVPKVVEQFDTFGQKLPPLTRATIWFSEFLQNYGLILFGLLVAVFFGFRFALKTPRIRRRWDGFKLRIPLTGRLHRDVNAARFSRTMAGLVGAGTPALAAMDTAQHTLRNSVMRDAMTGAVERVRSGAPMSAALKETGVFPPLVTQMVMGGEASGDMGKMFAKSADYLEDEFNAQTTVFLTLLEPAIIIMLAGVVLMVVAAIFLPILQLNTLAY
ncbi:type II secretion system protein GspF [Litorimonas cladophorae]|uniref:Type II secretion system protein GspF n=1 Tax=Litorimonas cladophorae TaxID=1220491 RepID=A0A918KP97_9PROT|nr:type II secretion system inner membrane protein GspF [Litorimonas cladophorae]GGX69264.1 type II secretion system protein GspF [Litorimonas cladophorae]